MKKQNTNTRVEEMMLEYYVENSSKTLPAFSPKFLLKEENVEKDFSFETIQAIRKGVSKQEWKELLAAINATEKEFEAILPTSISSMQKKENYDPETSERIYEIAKLFGLGHAVFDHPDDFKNWLHQASSSLGNKTPFELLDSSIGFSIIEKEIIRIQYNVYS